MKVALGIMCIRLAMGVSTLYYVVVHGDLVDGVSKSLAGLESKHQNFEIFDGSKALEDE